MTRVRRRAALRGGQLSEARNRHSTRREALELASVSSAITDGAAREAAGFTSPRAPRQRARRWFLAD
jgi:hypothetical protein